jgi:hypothetical protein
VYLVVASYALQVIVDVTPFSAISRMKTAQVHSKGHSHEHDISAELSDEDEQLDLDLVEREERMEAALTRLHNCMMTGQKLNMQISLMLKGWKATLP